MDKNISGIIYSAVLIAFFGGIALLIKRKKPLSDMRREVARKIVHIGVSNWYFIYASCFTTWVYPVCVLLFMTVVNYFVELKTGSRRSWGTVYFPISILLMIALKEAGFGTTSCIGCGLLGMGYADGVSALVGMRFGKRKMFCSSRKSIIGSLCVFVITFAVLMIMGSFSTVWEVLLICFVTMLFEAYTPLGLDNITVPLVIYILCVVFMKTA